MRAGTGAVVVFDERDLFRLTRDLGEYSGWFGSGLGALYGMALTFNKPCIVEVGVFRGGSTRAFLLAARRRKGWVVSIDTADRYAAIPNELHDRWTLVVGRSDDQRVYGDVQRVMRDPARGNSDRIDLLFIDGEHTYDCAKKDLVWYGQHVRPGGMIVMDDCWPMFPGVLQAFNEQQATWKALIPYGQLESNPGGRDRTMGVLVV